MNYILETVSCPLCRANDHKPYITNARELYNGSDNYFNVVKCNCCEMTFTNPRPTKETIDFFYPDSARYYQPKIKNKENTFEEKIRRTLMANYYGYKFQPPFNKFIASIFRKHYGHELAVSHTPRYTEEGKLLDIGCSWGGYAAKMSNYGWNTYGIEINKKSADYARDSLGLINIYNGFFDEYQCEGEFFDVIHMSMVLEHLHDPVRCLNRIYSLLKKGGQLIVSVPNISGFEARIYHKYAYTLQVPQHLNHFSPITINKMLEQCGFTVERIVHQTGAKDLIGSADYLDNKILYTFLSLKIMKRIFIKPFLYLLAKLGKTSRMSVYARK